MEVVQRDAWVKGIVCAGLLLNAVLAASHLYRRDIPGTLGDDLAGHVRHIHEYTLALKEGQVPPLVAPALNRGLRIPLFQYYSGTAFVLPGVLGLTGMGPYRCLKASILLLSFLGALALFGVLRSSVANARAAYLGATTFQLSGFFAVDLYTRGAYPEWVALQYAALVWWALLRLVDGFAAPRSAAARVAHLSLAPLALGLFIPCHPVQTVYTGLVLAIFVAAYTLDRWPWRAAGRTAALMVFVAAVGLLLTAWFWLPILHDYARLRITGHQVYRSVDETVDLVLGPWFRTHRLEGWAPQLGPHITLAALLTLGRLGWGRRRFQSAAAAGLLGTLVFLIVLPSLAETSPFCRGVQQVLFDWLKPMQYSYRLLPPAVLAGSSAVALAAADIDRWIPSIRARALVFLGAALFLVAFAWPFYHRPPLANPSHLSMTVAHVLSDAWDSQGVTMSYAMLGNDYRDYRWLRAGTLRLGENFDVPWEGVPFEAGMVLAEPDADPPRVFHNGEPVKVRATPRGESGERLISFTVVPGRGVHQRQPQALRFESSHPSVRVAALRFRPKGDAEWIRLPAAIERGPSAGARARDGAERLVRVPDDGTYQLPVCYFPGVHVTVNGQPARQVSVDRFLFTTFLPRGDNVVRVTSRPSPATAVLFGLGVLCLALFAAILFLLSAIGHRLPARKDSR